MYPRTHVPYLRNMERSDEHPMHRRSRHLYTNAKLGAMLGCSAATVGRLRRSFLTKRQKAYLNAVGYVAAFHPRRKAKDPSP